MQKKKHCELHNFSFALDFVFLVKQLTYMQITKAQLRKQKISNFIKKQNTSKFISIRFKKKSSR